MSGKEDAGAVRGEEALAAACGMIYLVGCGVRGTSPDRARVEAMDLEKVHSLCSFHSLESLAFMALEDVLGDEGADASAIDSSLAKKWADERNHAVWIELQFDVEREQVLSFLEERGIWYVPLKGIIMKDLYPGAGARQMADNDILFDSAFQPQVRDWFEARGYDVAAYDQGPHDSYHKKPVFNFEMHTMLFGGEHDPAWQEYYAAERLRSKLIPDESGSFARHFSDEDFYLHMIVHACKHFRVGGTGLRSLLDVYVYVYTEARGESMDWAYVRGELEALGLADFEEQARGLSRKLFANPDDAAHEALFAPDSEYLTEQERAMLRRVLFSGTYGTLRNSVESKLNALDPQAETHTFRTKARYLWGRLFPRPELFCQSRPFYARHRWLLPVGYVCRLFYRGIKSGGKALSEVRMVRKM